MPEYVDLARNPMDSEAAFTWPNIISCSVELVVNKLGSICGFSDVE
jgi:hypothetical protein